MTNVANLLKDHVTLSTTCIDRLYVNGYVPKLQTSGQLCYFLRDHLGYPIPSPALFRPLHDRFVKAVGKFADRNEIPVVQFRRGERKDEVAKKHRSRFDQPSGVVFIGVAQEKAWSFKAQKRRSERGSVWFDFSRQWVAVNHYYFYVQDPDWGPAFLKTCTYMPYSVKLCLNGHEWAKQQLSREGVGFESLDNGFLSCEDPKRLQQICDGLGAADVQRFFDRWSRCLPWPLTPADRAAGFDHRLSIWQCEVSLTQVFERPLQGRHFFEEVIRDNLDLGRPDRVNLLFPLRSSRRTPPPLRGHRTRVITSGVNPSIHVEHKRSHVKQYFKDERALRTETTINNPEDFRVRKGVRHLEHLRTIGNQVNRKVLEVERISHNCALSQDTLDHLHKPTVEGNQRASSLRFGDSRVMALLRALCLFFHLPAGFRNKDLKAYVAQFLGLDPDRYSSGKMTYDLRRLRLKRLIHRVAGTHRYTVTTFGLCVAFFYSKVHLRIMRPGTAAMPPVPISAPQPLRDAYRRLDQQIQKLVEAARISAPG